MAQKKRKFRIMHQEEQRLWLIVSGDPEAIKELSELDGVSTVFPSDSQRPDWYAVGISGEYDYADVLEDIKNESVLGSDIPSAFREAFSGGIDLCENSVPNKTVGRDGTKLRQPKAPGASESS